jgi:hypothetical protein
MLLPALAVLAGALSLLFFAVFTSFYFRNRREAMALRDRLAAEAEAAVGTPPALDAAAPGSPAPDVSAQGATAGGSAAGDRPEGV